MSDSDENEIICKVVLVGEYGVDKTGIISKYINPSGELFDSPSSCYCSKKIEISEENKIIKFDIWETAGQERYRDKHKNFYKSTDVFVLVYDITKKSTFDELKNYWIKDIKENSNKDFSKIIIYKKFIIFWVVLALVGNNIEKYESQEVDDAEAENFAEEISAIFQLVSSKENIGIEDLFYIIGKSFLQKTKNEKAEREKEKDREIEEEKKNKIEKLLNKYINF